MHGNAPPYASPRTDIPAFYHGEAVPAQRSVYEKLVVKAHRVRRALADDINAVKPPDRVSLIQHGVEPQRIRAGGNRRGDALFRVGEDPVEVGIHIRLLGGGHNRSAVFTQAEDNIRAAVPIAAGLHRLAQAADCGRLVILI